MRGGRNASTSLGLVLATLAGLRIVIALAADLAGLQPLASQLFAALGSSPLAVLNSNLFIALVFLSGVALILYGRSGPPAVDERAQLHAIATKYFPTAFRTGVAALDHISRTAYQDPNWPSNEAWELMTEYRSRCFRLYGDRVHLEAESFSKTALELSNSVKDHYAYYVELEFWIDSHGRPAAFKETAVEEKYLEAKKLLEQELNVAWGLKVREGVREATLRECRSRYAEFI